MIRKFKNPSPYIALIPILLGVFIAADDQTVVVTILPEIMSGMYVSINDLDYASWTVTAYLLGYVCAMPTVGRISDVCGHRRLFIWSMFTFMVGSMAVALSPNMTWLIAARIFQAVGAGALVPISLAIVADLFQPEQRGIPLGLIGASVEAGGVIGPLWGGIIIRHLQWQWVFWMNIPLGASVLIMVAVFLSPSPTYKARLDYIGGILITLSLVTLTLGLTRMYTIDKLTITYFIASILSLTLLISRQKIISDPLLPKAMFQTWAFRGANTTHIFIGAALIIGMVTIPLMANTVQQLTPLEGGLRLMRLTAAIPLGAVISSFICQRLDYRIPAIVGLGLMALGFGLMSNSDVLVSEPIATVHLLTTGLGFGIVITPILLASTNSVKPKHRGVAAGFITSTRLIGMTIGLATLSAWGDQRFEKLVSSIPSPIDESSVLFESQLIKAGLTLFNDFFLVAMVISLVAILPAAFMSWAPSRNITHSNYKEL